MKSKKFAADRLASLLDAAETATTSEGKGSAWEDVVVYLLECVPGITKTVRDSTDSFQSEEIDVTAWNDGHPKGFQGFPQVIFAEAKNWASPVGANEVTVFGDKLRRSSLTFGLLFAASGITGDADRRSAAQQMLADNLQDGRKIIVITNDDLRRLNSVSDFIDLVKHRICELSLRRALSGV